MGIQLANISLVSIQLNKLAPKDNFRVGDIHVKELTAASIQIQDLVLGMLKHLHATDSLYCI